MADARDGFGTWLRDARLRSRRWLMHATRDLNRWALVAIWASVQHRR